MSEITSRAALGRSLLRVALPALAMLLGLTLAIMGVFSVHAGPGLRVAVIAAGGAAGITGFLTLLWGIRARYSDDAAVRARSAVRSDISLGAMILVLGLTGLGGSVQAMTKDFGPALVADAQLERLTTYRGRLRHGGDAHLYLAGNPRAFAWHCNFDCTALADLRRLEGASGMPVHVTAIGQNLVGLTAQGQEFLWVEAERDRLKATHASVGLLAALVAVCAGAYIPWRRRTGYRSDRSTGPDYRVLLQNRLTKARKVQP